MDNRENNEEYCDYNEIKFIHTLRLSFPGVCALLVHLAAVFFKYMGVLLLGAPVSDNTIITYFYS